MDVEEVRGALARINWNHQFNQATLKRANVYLRDNHLESLRFEESRRGDARLRGLVRGSNETLYEPWIKFHRESRDAELSLTGSCDCPVVGPCKHQALILLYAQMFTPDQWPKDKLAEALPTSHTPSAQQIEALPGWLRTAMTDARAPEQVPESATWDSWFSRLAPPPTSEAAMEDAEERRFGLILREAEGRLTVQPAFLRPGRHKAGGWVDPQPLVLEDAGPTPAPADGWNEEDAVALGALLASGLGKGRPNDPIEVSSVHVEAALQHLLPHHPVYWQRGSNPLEPGPELPMRLLWEEQSDGSQVLTADVSDEGEPTLLLRGHGLWYVQPVARRYGPVRGDAQLLDLVEQAPKLQPEDVPDVQHHLKETKNLPVSMPRTRKLRIVQPTPTPLVQMSVLRVNPSERSTQSAALRIGVATLHFDYAGHRLAPFSGEAQQRVIDGDDILEIERDLAHERRAEARLEPLGLVDAVVWSYDRHFQRGEFLPNQFLLIPDQRKPPLTPEAWIPILAELSAAGFEIEYEHDFPRDDVVEIDEWIAEVEEAGNAWFDVSLGIDVDGERIDLLPILRRLLADPDFPMRKPEDEADDAAWQVRIDESRSVRLPMARLRAMLEPLLEWLTGSEDGLRLHRTQAERLQRVADDAVLLWRGGDRLRKRIEQLRAASVPADTPDGFRAVLRPYQRDGLAWLNFLSDAGLGGILADDMGLGKTVQVLAHLLSEKARGRLDVPALVVAPTSLVGNWRDEAARFAPDLRVLVLHGADRAARYDDIAESDLVITTYPLLPRDRDSLCAQQFSVLILDEAQAIKNARSQAAQVVREIPAQRRLAMTGTPLENHLGELWAQFDAVEPGLLGSETSFTRTYRTPIEKHGDSDRQQRLARRIGALLLRRRKDDVLTELPPKTEIVHSLELLGAQRQLYETLRLAQHARVRESIAHRGLGQSGIVVIDALLKLRQACCDPRLVKLESARKVKESAKLDALLELLDNLRAEGRHVLVFSQFTQMLALIGQALDKRRIKFLSLTGDTPSATRTDLVRRFQDGEVPVFLISLKAGGVGLNLTAADTVIHYDPWWNPAVEAQATDRAHRIGQDKPVFVYKLICAGTVEEKIQAMQERKAELARAVLEGGSTTALRFDESDLAELFGPL